MGDVQKFEDWIHSTYDRYYAPDVYEKGLAIVCPNCEKPLGILKHDKKRDDEFSLNELVQAKYYINDRNQVSCSHCDTTLGRRYVTEDALDLFKKKQFEEQLYQSMLSNMESEIGKPLTDVSKEKIKQSIKTGVQEHLGG